MNGHSQSKINRLINLWPRGTIAVQAWLTKQSISRQLADSYQKHHWIERIGSGAYKLKGDKIDWRGGLYTLQNQLQMKVHVAAKTALEMQGYAHFVPIGEFHDVWLFKSVDETRHLPTWFKNYFAPRYRFCVHTRKLFNLDGSDDLVELTRGEYTYKASSPERAIMEYLDLIPTHATVDHARLLMESLRTLRPKRVQFLLEHCCSVKVKRLFLYLADIGRHAWFERLNLDTINLGKGKRVIGDGGMYVTKYQLSVPNKDNNNARNKA